MIPKGSFCQKHSPLSGTAVFLTGGPAAACLLPAPILPAILQNKSFRVGKGELEGEGEGLFQKVLPFLMRAVKNPLGEA